MRRIVDISAPLRAGIASDPPGMEPSIVYRDHTDTVPGLLSFFPGLRREDLPGGEAWALEELRITTHNGTHLDAPYHYHSTQDGGRPAMRIDEIPLEWCFAPGVKLDFRHFADGYVAGAADVEAELDRIGYRLSAGDIVLVNTSAGAKYGRDDYVTSGCGVGREATSYLLDRGVRVTGTDAWSWDAPFVHTARRYAATGDPSIIWEGHRAGMETGYCHIEKLHNLESLPAFGYMVACFPFKIEAASAGFTRAVAIFEEPHGRNPNAVQDRPIREGEAR